MTQAELAERSQLSRPYVSRLEKGKVDPSLSALRRLSVALDVSIGQLIEGLPPERPLSREEMDGLAHAALYPGSREARSFPEARILALMIDERRKALGLTAPGKVPAFSRRESQTGLNASRWLRASLGEKQWAALLRRIDKLASSAPAKS